MTRTIHRYLSAATLLAAAALSAGGCGASDEEEIRAVTKEFMRLDAKDADRACELITARAQAQLTVFAGDGECEKALRKVEQDEGEQPKPREIDKAPLKVRDDRAVLTIDDQRLGLRKVDGTWRVDNLFNGMLVEPPRRLPAALSHGSDEQQVRASITAFGDAYRKRDYERACDLLSYGAEAQLFVGLAFASFADTEGSEAPPADASCPWVHRKLERIIGKKAAFADEVPSAARIDAAEVSIRGDRATVSLPGDDERLIRQDGHWLMAGEEKGITFEDDVPSPASLQRCWKRSGANIAAGGKDLRFAIHGTAKAIAIKPGLVSVKGESADGVGWRVFYTLPADGEDPGLGVFRKPRTVRAVAYVRDAAAHPRVIEKMRACGS